MSFGATALLVLPACFASASMPAMISLIAACAVLERLDHDLLGDFLRAGFDHHDAVVGARDDQIELAALALSKVGLMTNWPSIRPTRTPAIVFWSGIVDSASAADAPVIASTSVSFSRVRREHERDDLGLVAPAVGEERTDGPVDEAAGEHFLLGRLAFTLEEPAGDAARGVGVLLVVDGERKEVDPFARVGRRAGA